MYKVMYKIFPLNWSSRFATLLYSSPNATNLYTNDFIAFSDFFLLNWVALNGQHRWIFVAKLENITHSMYYNFVYNSFESIFSNLKSGWAVISEMLEKNR